MRVRGLVIRFIVWLFDWLRALALPWLGAPEVLAPTALVVIIAAGNGEALGLPSLLFPEPDVPAFVSGAAVTFLFLEIAFVSFLLEQAWFGAWVERRRVRFFQSRSIVPYAVLAVGIPAAFVLWFAFAKASPWWFVGVLVMSLAFVIVRVTIARSILRNLRRATDGVIATMNTTQSRTLRGIGALAHRVRPSTMTQHDETMHALQFVVAAIVLCVHVAVSLTFIVFFDVGFPPMFVICGLAALATSACGALRNYAGRWYSGVSLLVLVLAVVFVPTPSCVNEYSQLAPKGTERPEYSERALEGDAMLLDDDAVFHAWRASAARSPLVGEQLAQKWCNGSLVDAPHLLLVAVSGGGIRAAGWSASVLQSLERDLNDANDARSLASHVRIIAGASGGMVGAGAWVGSLDENGAHQTLQGLNPRDAVMSDALPSVARALAFIPFLDRGRALERVWTTNSFGLAQTFEHVRAGEAEGWRPSLVFTPMSVEDGRRVFVSNLDLANVTASSGPLLFPVRVSDAVDDRYSLNGVQLFTLFPFTAPSLHIATAARMSASFPYVSAAAELPTRPPVRLVDAGYYDNYGVDVLAHWLLEHERDVKDCTAGVAVLEIRDESGYGKRNAAALDVMQGRRNLIVSEVGSPPEAILAAREASMSFRNDELLEMLHRVFNGGDSERFFTSVVFELKETAPLSWALSDADRARLAMTEGASPTKIHYDAAVGELQAWLALAKQPSLDVAPPQAQAAAE